jgi:predicted transcriptional regulator
MTVKEQARQMLDELPESATWDDVLYALYVRQKIERGFDDIKNGRVISHEEVRRQFLK